MDVDALAAALAPKLLESFERLLAQRDNGEYLRGTLAIARFLGVSEDTFRRRHKTKIPICGYEEYNHRGKNRIRPVCKKAELAKYRENLPTKTKR